jgi:hypothetical protein
MRGNVFTIRDRERPEGSRFITSNVNECCLFWMRLNRTVVQQAAPGNDPARGFKTKARLLLSHGSVTISESDIPRKKHISSRSREPPAAFAIWTFRAIQENTFARVAAG